MDEREIHLHRGAPAERSGKKFCIPDDDTAPHLSQCDDDALWAIDCYHDRHAKTLMGMGCKPLPATHGAGRLFKVTAQQLIEFRKRKKKELTDEQRSELSERMRRINAQRNGLVI